MMMTTEEPRILYLHPMLDNIHQRTLVIPFISPQVQLLKCNRNTYRQGFDFKVIRLICKGMASFFQKSILYLLFQKQFVKKFYMFSYKIYKSLDSLKKNWDVQLGLQSIKIIGYILFLLKSSMFHEASYQVKRIKYLSRSTSISNFDLNTVMEQTLNNKRKIQYMNKSVN